MSVLCIMSQGFVVLEQGEAHLLTLPRSKVTVVFNIQKFEYNVHGFCNEFPVEMLAIWFGP